MHGADAWWAGPAVAAVAKSPGPDPARRLRRRLAGAADLRRRGDAYGVDPRPPIVEAGRRSGCSTCATRTLADHLRAVAPAGLGGCGAERGGRRHGGRRAHPAARLVGAASPRAGPGGALGLPGDVGAADAAGPRPTWPRPAAAPRSLVPAARDAGLRGDGRAGPRRAATTWSSRALRRRRSPTARRARSEGGRRRAGGRAPVRPGPDPARRHGDPYAAAPPGPAGGRVALGDLRRGHPRRAVRRGVQALGVSGACRSGRRAHLPVLHVLDGGRPASPSTGAPDPRLPQLHRPRATTRHGSRSVGGPPGPAEELALLAPRAVLGLADSAFNEGDLREAGLPAHRRGAGAGRLRAPRRGARPPGGRPSWPPWARRGAPTGSSSGGWCPPRPSTSWSRPCGPTAASTTPTPGSTWSAAPRATRTWAALRAFVADLGLAGPCGSPARSPTPPWPPTSPRPTSTCRSRSTRGSGCPCSRPWPPGSRWWRWAPGAVAETVGRRRAGARAGRPARTWPPPSTGCCRTTVLRPAWPRRRVGAGPRPLPEARRRRGSVVGAIAGRRGVAVSSLSVKVAFVTPRYGPEVMGGAETAARQLAEHLVADCGWEVEVYSTCALDHVHLGGRARAGTTRLNGVTVHRFPSARGRDARLLRPRRPAAGGPPPDHPRAVAALGRAQRPGHPRPDRGPVRHRTSTWPPSTPTSTTRASRGSARCPCRRCCTRRPTTSRRCTCRCSGAPTPTPTPSATTPWPSARWSSACTRWPTGPRSCSGSGWGSRRARGRPGGEVLGLGDRPYLVSVGRVDEHKGSTMLAAFFATYKERHPGPLALALVGPVSAEIPDAPRHRGDRHRRRGRQVGHRARRPGLGLALGPRVVLPGGARGLGGAGAGGGQRHLRPDPGALRALGRRAVVRLLPRVRGGAGPAAGRPRPAGRPRAAGPGLRGPPLPVAGPDRAATPAS